jgi:serine/threonine protein phosphatase PrpC
MRFAAFYLPLWMQVDEVNDRFMIVGSDGIWEFIDNEEAIEIVSKYSDPQTVRCRLDCGHLF